MIPYADLELHPAEPEPEPTSGAVIVYVALAVVGGLALAGFVWWVVLGR